MSKKMIEKLDCWKHWKDNAYIPDKGDLFELFFSILSGDDSDQRIEELERRVAELIDKYNDYMHDGDCKEYMVKKDAPAVCTCDPASLRTGFHLIDCPTRNKPESQAVDLCDCTSFIRGKCPVCDKKSIEKENSPTPPEPSKDDGQTPREKALEVAELLWSIGWASPNDAQTKRLEKALGEIKTILVRSHDQKDKVAISSRVANTWLEYMDKAKHYDEIISQSMVNEIRKALGEK